MLNINPKALILSREKQIIPHSYKPYPNLPSTPKDQYSTIQKVPISRKGVASHCRYQSTFSSPKAPPQQQIPHSPHHNNKTPKISFSYSRKKEQNEGNSIKYVAGSCRQIFKEPEVNAFPVQQFSIVAKKVSKLDKKEKLKLHHCVSHVIFPTPSIIPEIEESVLPFLPNIKQNGKNSSLSSENSDKQAVSSSKVASTQAASSTFGGSRHNMSNLSEYTEKLSLIDRISPSKLLKKTIILSKYDFGGMFSRQNYKSQNQNPPAAPSLKVSSTSDNQRSSNIQINISSYRQLNKWQNCMKCLFTDNDLKESIHCGPDLRTQQPSNSFLVGFGREVEASCIPEQ